MLLHGGDALDGCLRGGDGGDGGNPRQHCSPADGLLIEEGILAARSVDDELNAVALDQVHNVRPALLDLEDPLDAEAGLLQYVGRALCGYDPETEVDVAASQVDGCRLVMVVDAEEDRAAGGQHLPR